MYSDERIAHIDELDSLELDELLEREILASNDVDLFVRIGGQYLKLGQLDTTEEYYARALALDADDAWTHAYLGNLAYARRRYRDAVKCFSRAAELLPNVACPFWCLGDVYDKMGNDDLAEANYKRAVAIERDSRQAKRHLDEWYERRYTPDLVGEQLTASKFRIYAESPNFSSTGNGPLLH